MFGRATGWLGYTPGEALACNVNDIEIALGGFRDLLKQLFGSPDKPGDKPGAKRPMSAARFRVMAEKHNRAMAGRSK